MRDARPLNVAFFADRLRDLQLKQWWLAEQIGVDRKTVARWLSGRVKRIRAENLVQAARALRCRPEELVLSDGVEALATRSEQIAAARLIQQESLVDTLEPAGRWRMLESLIRAVLRPDLPLPILGELYNQLSISAWRQSNLTRGEKYAQRALEIGKRCRSKSVVAAATLNLATLAAFRGRLGESLTLYQECLGLGKYLSDEVIQGKAMSNYGATCLDAGEFKLAMTWQRRAIRVFQRLRRPMNEAIAWIGFAQALKEEGKIAASLKACATATLLAKQANFRRGVSDASLLRAELLALCRQTTLAGEELRAARKGYEALDIREPQPDIIAGLIARLEGRFRDAERHLAAGLKLAREFPVDRVRLLAEYARLESARGRRGPARRAEARRAAIFRSLRKTGELF